MIMVNPAGHGESFRYAHGTLRYNNKFKGNRRAAAPRILGTWPVRTTTW